MKTIGILTHYQVHNYGAILQMYRLYNTLKNLVFSPTVLTYRNDFSFMDSALVNKYNLSIKSIPFYLGYIKKQEFAKTMFNVKKQRLLSRFKVENYTFPSLEICKMLLTTLK